MADNMDEEQLGTPQNSQSVNPSDEIIPTADKKSINPNQAAENMEVHKHPHHITHKKKWGEYLLEFFMLFLAVFLGFIAENVREHEVEKKHEKVFIKSLLEDLKLDTVTFTKNANNFDLILEKDDSLVHLLNSRDVKNYGSELYYFERLSTRSIPLAINDATFQQLKNSSGFRVISNNEVSKKITEYYNQLIFINYLQQLELIESEDFRKLAIDVFDPVIFNSIISADNSVMRPVGNPALLTYDIQVLRRLSGMVAYHRNSKFASSKSQNDMKIAAAELIALIKREYQFD
ncbi:MAG TPA: hypothetical protein VFV08_10715 [Puia sp.]|nr:hypothetical protein [Puia sp.]